MAVEIVGSVNVDIILSVERLPRPGETVLAGDATRMPGGKGANQAVAAARMGARTRLSGAVGADEAGAWMRASLEAAGVDASSLHVLDGQRTGTAYIAVDARGENQIIVDPGANAAFLPALLSTPAADTRILLAQNEVPVKTLAAAFGRGGAVRILNAAPAVDEAAMLFPLVDILIVNEHELARYLALPGLLPGPEGALAARALLTREDQAVVVTLGAEGAVAVWRDRHLHAPAIPVSPIDTIGAGDCFCGALAALLDEGSSIEAALPMANAAAALCTQERGAAPAMPSRAAVESFLREAAPDAATEYTHAIKNPDAARVS